MQQNIHSGQRPSQNMAKHPQNPTCDACDEPLNTANNHNWRCENEDCAQYHQGHRDLQE